MGFWISIGTIRLLSASFFGLVIVRYCEVGFKPEELLHGQGWISSFFYYLLLRSRTKAAGTATSTPFKRETLQVYCNGMPYRCLWMNGRLLSFGSKRIGNAGSFVFSSFFFFFSCGIMDE
jgi:hypothetical protein